MNPRLRGALSHVAARAVGSRFAKPIARAVVVVTGLVFLAVIGHSAVATTEVSTLASTSTSTPTPTSTSTPTSTASLTELPRSSRVSASPDDPVILNTATADDLRRLPGIGEKRASAILSLRARLGRFRAVEDLLKVKGIGRATLKRLRPLVRLDPRPQSDADAAAPPG